MTMSSRCTATLFVWLLAACSQSISREQKTVEAEPVPYQRAITDRTRPAKTAVDVPLPEGRRIVQAIHRVRPDRRFVNAAADVVEIAGGKTVSQVALDFDGLRWQVDVAGSPSIALPELAQFGEALEELTKWAAAQQRAGGAATPPDALAAADADLDRFYPRFLFAALRRLRPDAAGLQRAARAAALLSVQAYDEFEINDPLDGRALALLASARARNPGCCREEEALLAHAFSYRTEARTAARSLPDGSFAKALILGGEASGAAGSWLASRKAIAKGDAVERIDAEAVPILFAAKESGDSAAIAASVAGELIRILGGKAEELALVPGPLSVNAAPPSAPLLREFESKLDRRAGQDAGVFLDDRAVRSFYEALWYSALYFQFTELNDRLGVPDEVKKLVDSLKPRSATGANVVSWMRYTSAAEYGREPGVPANHFLRSTRLLGGVRRHELVKALTGSLGFVHPQVRQAARELQMTIDTRPAELFVGAMLADMTGHVRNRQIYARAALDRGAEGVLSTLAEVLFNEGDTARLRELARDRSAKAEERLTALYYLEHSGEKSLHSLYEAAIADTGFDPSYLRNYIDYLNSINDAGSKERFVRLVMSKNQDLDPISEANLVASLVDALNRQKRYGEAWKAAEPHMNVYTAAILATGIEALQGLGRNDEALELGRGMVERYPSADTRADFAKVLWRMRRHADAARLFDPNENANAYQLFADDVPKAFLQAFSDEEMSEALRAYEELVKVLPVGMSNAFPTWAHVTKRWQLALALEERFQKIETKGLDRSIQQSSAITGYVATRELRGEEEAIRWYLDHVPAGDELRGMTSLLVDGHTDLAIGLAQARPPRERGTGSLLAAALLLKRVPRDDPRWNLVDAVIGTPPANGEERTTYEALRYFRGQGTTESVAAADDSPKGRTIAAYFLGTASAAEGRYDDALEELLVAGEGPANYIPASLATSQLLQWRAKRIPWSEMQKRKVL